MKALFAFLTVNVVFLAGNALAAGVYLGGGTLLQAAPWARDEYWAWLALGIAAIASGICFMVWAFNLISRSRG